MKWDNVSALRAADEAGDEGLDAASEYLLELADSHVPYMSGALRMSGRVDVHDGEASVYYDTPYAVKLHEDRRLHINAPGVGQWLKKAAQRSARDLLPYFAEAMKVKFRRGG